MAVKNNPTRKRNPKEKEDKSKTISISTPKQQLFGESVAVPKATIASVNVDDCFSKRFTIITE